MIALIKAWIYKIKCRIAKRVVEDFIHQGIKKVWEETNDPEMGFDIALPELLHPLLFEGKSITTIDIFESDYGNHTITWV